jgi:sulfatase modifying factor 1
MKKASVLAILVCLLAVVNIAWADNIRGINIDFVPIGHAGNGTDPATGNLYGAVSSSYRIGKYEITAAQWQTINTAAGIGDSGYWSGNQPVADISWYEAAQFCNYLTSGDKSLGAYQLGTNGSITINRAAAVSTYGTAYVIPTENEWYKAAYFKPDASGYSLYANGTSTLPVAGVNSNYDNVIGSPWDKTNGTPEQNGTFDMMGNVWEWNETLIVGSSRGIRGGMYGGYDFGADFFASSYRDSSDSVPLYYEYPNLGFRVATIPEPATLLLLGLGGLVLRRGRK